MDKRGISALVATVLTILITVAGIGIIWVAIVPMIQENIEFDALDGRVTILSSGGYTVYDASREVAIVQVKRDVDDGVMNRIKIMFLIDGNSVSSNVVAPGSGQTKTYTFDLSGYGEPESVSVAAIFVSSSGSEKEGSVSSNVKISGGKISEVDADVYELGRDYFYEMPMTGLVSWWKFDGDATDSVGENDGTCSNNCPTYVDGVAIFDGDDDSINYGDGESIQLDSKDFTILVWFKPELNNAFRFVYHKWRPNLWIDEYNDRFVFDLASSSLDNLGITQINTNIENKWYFSVQRYKSPEAKSWIYDADGLVGSDSNTGASNIDGSDGFDFIVSHNGWSGGSNSYFKGSIDNVMIFDRALSQDEITAIYENQKK